MLPKGWTVVGTTLYFKGEAICKLRDESVYDSRRWDWAETLSRYKRDKYYNKIRDQTRAAERQIEEDRIRC